MLLIFYYDYQFISSLVNGRSKNYKKQFYTIINGIFAAALIISQQVFKKNIIKQFLGEALTLPENIWNNLNLAWAVFFATCGLLNWYIAFNFSLETWVNFKVFGLTGLTFVFAIGSVISLYKYMPDEQEEEKEQQFRLYITRFL